MPYDTERERIVKLEDIDRLYFGAPDRNEARERMGIGAFLALYARLYHDDTLLVPLR